MTPQFIQSGIRLGIGLLLALLSSACSNEGGDSDFLGPLSGDSSNCPVTEQNRFVHEVLKDYYLWYDTLPQTLDYAAFSSPEQTLDYLRYDARDRFSAITDAASFNALYGDGQFTGYGFSFLINTDSSVTLRYVFDDSAAGRAGLQRGDNILSVNGETVASIIQRSGWDDALGTDLQTAQITLSVQRGSNTFSVTLDKAVININSVLYSGLVSAQSAPTAYLVFNSFLATSPAELAPVFADFKAQGVTRLILDLRYNGGGVVDVAKTLASYLNRVEDNQQTLVQLAFNDRHSNLNETYTLEPLADALTLDELIVITTGATCSASEMIINGLQPYAVNVRSVGSKTCGKPVGMSAFEFCGKALLPVIFESHNRDGIGDYYDGIGVNCDASDDLNYGFADSNEPMMGEALQLLNTGSCSSSPRARPSAPATLPYPDNSLRAFIGAY